MNLRAFLFQVIHALSQGVFILKQILRKFIPNHQVRVLVYHQVCPASPSLPCSVTPWCVTKESFAEQMEYLYRGGYHVLSVSEVIEYLQSGNHFPPKSVAITFDDGFRNNFSFAFQELVRYGFKATFYLTTAYIGENSRFPWIQSLPKEEDQIFSQPMNWEEIKLMSEKGMTFGSHTQSHPNLANLSLKQMKTEVADSISLLKEKNVAMSNSFVAPFGVWGKTARALRMVLAKNGLSIAFLGKFGAFDKGKNPLDLPRITIYGDDTLDVFIKKIDGAYDWFGPFHELYQNLRELAER